MKWREKEVENEAKVQFSQISHTVRQSNNTSEYSSTIIKQHKVNSIVDIKRFSMYIGNSHMDELTELTYWWVYTRF